MLKNINKIFITLAFFALAISTVSAQVTAGRVNGSVSDTNGAVVEGGTVSLKNKATGLVLNAESNGSGSFLFPNVLPGEYEIKIEKSGFQTITQTITVSLNQETAVTVSLPPSGVGTTVVDVTAGGDALIQTETSQLGKSFDTKQVENLPTFGGINSLALLSPNVVAQSSGTAGSGGTVGGVRPRYNVFTTDGVENNNPSVTGPSASVIQDAVSEFTLLTNNFNAEFGQGGGGQFVTITKGGTNEFHGNAFVYLQNQRLNAASSSEERSLRSGAITEKPRYKDIRYGFTLGGPIVKDKLFFFGAIERRPISQDGSSSSYLAPTAVGLAQIAALPGASAFVVNLLRNNLVLPSAQTTSQTVLGTSVAFGTVNNIIPISSEDKQYQINVDYNANEKNQFRFRYSHDDFSAVGAGNGSPKFNNSQVFKTRLFSLTYVKSFSSSTVNELRLSYRRALSDNPLVDPANLTFPNIAVAPLNLAIGPSGNLPQSSSSHSYQVFDTLTYITGAHSFKFGAEYRNLITSGIFLPRGRGDYVYTTFDELIQDRAPTNVGLRGVGSGGFVGNNQKYYFFGQDDWKISSNLTLNLGLRYELVTLPRDAALQQLNAVASIPNVLNFGIPKIDKNNYAPRLGFAYSPSMDNKIGNFLFGEGRKSSIRGNVSVSYAEIFQNLILLQLPPQFQQELNIPTAQTAFGLNLQTRFLEQGGLPARPIPPTSRAAARAGTGSFITDQRSGETYAFALSYQRELTNTMAIEFRYLGTRGRHLPIQRRLNGAFTNRAALTIPTFLNTPSVGQLAGLTTLGAIRARSDVSQFPLDNAVAPEFFGGFVTAFEPVGNSNYDSGAVSLTRRFTKGLAFTAAYTFSKTLSDTDNELFTSLVNPRRIEDHDNVKREWSLSAFDIPHRFVFSANYEPTYFNEKGGMWKKVLGDFIFAPIFQMQSGQPITPLAGIDANLNFDAAGDRSIVNPNGTVGTASSIRAVDATGATVALGSASTVAYVANNPTAQYIRTGPGARSTAGRNTLRSNGFNRTDLTALKNFRFGEDKYNLQMGAEIFNLWNQRIFTLSGLAATSNAFANTSSPLFNSYSTGNFSGRTVQFRAKFIF